MQTPSRVRLPDHDNDVCWDLSVRSDGGRFAYVSGVGGGTEVTRLWTIPSSGGEPIPLTVGFTNVWSPTWSKDGSTVFYVSNRGATMDLWQQQVTEEGRPVGAPVALTSGVGMRSAAFSRDGTQLAYTRGGPVSNVWRVPILSDRRGNQDLWRLPTSGGDMIPITTDPAPDWDPTWSPDGSQIAFYAYRSGNREIWVMPSGGGAARQLTFHPGGEGSPRWSPDGTEIMFGSSRSGRRSAWIVNANGGEPRALNRSGGEWLPDGRGFIVAGPKGTFSRVFRDGSTSVPLPGTAPDRGGGVFQVARDGQSIYYAVILGLKEDQNLWKMSLNDGTISQLTRLDGHRGRLGYQFAADDDYLYFIWHEDEADIWVMDVVKHDGKTQ